MRELYRITITLWVLASILSGQTLDDEKIRQELIEAQARQAVDRDAVASQEALPKMVELGSPTKSDNSQSNGNDPDYFGYEFINNSQKFQVWDNLPVGDAYRLGPGDELVITLWGDTESMHSYTVSKEGSIYIQPRVGNIQVASLTLKEVQALLFKRLSSVYATLGSRTYMDVTLGKLKAINVSFVGEASTPGMLAIHPMSTVLTGIIQAGGIRKSGSLRKIQVLRNNKVHAVFDLYDYLIEGDTKAEIRLHDGDVILVPPRLSTVTLLGEVVRPGIYEIKPGETLNQLIHFAGTVKLTAQSRLAVRRIKGLSERENEDNLYRWTSVDLADAESFTLRDGDLIKILAVNAENQQVSIRGPVLAPGDYPLTEGLTLLDLLKTGGGVFSEEHWDKLYPYRADLIRLDSRTLTSTLIPIQLDRLQKGDLAQNLVLQDGDILQLYPASLTTFRKKVTILGNIPNPGEYSLDENMGLRDLILRSGGLDSETASHEVEIYRIDSASPEESYVSIHKERVTPDQFNQFQDVDDYQLNHRDQVVVRKDPAVRYQENVVISGEVAYPGVYSLMSDLRSMEDLIEAAGGYTREAFSEGIQLTRSEKTVAWFNLSFNLLPGDMVRVPRRPGTVNVFGEVNNPGPIEFKKRSSLEDYLDAAGGLTINADKHNIVVTYASGRSSQDGFLSHPKIEEGCTIKVYMKEETEPFRMTEFLKEIASISASLATIFFIVTR